MTLTCLETNQPNTNYDLSMQIITHSYYSKKPNEEIKYNKNPKLVMKDIN